MTRMPAILWPVLSLTLIPSGNAPGADGSSKLKPNILHIHADDHRPDGLGRWATARCRRRTSTARETRDGLHALLHAGLDDRGGMSAQPHDDAHRPVAAAHPRRPAGEGPGEPVPSLPTCRRGGLRDLPGGKGGNEYRAGIEAFDTTW